MHREYLSVDLRPGESALGHYVGIDVRAKIKGFSFDLNLEYGTTGGLTNQVASLSLTKFF